MTNHPEHRRLRFTMRASASMPCRDVARSLWEYLDGALAPERAAVVTAHIEGCALCRRRQEEARAFLRAIASTQGTDTAPDALRERIDALLRGRGYLS